MLRGFGLGFGVVLGLVAGVVAVGAGVAALQDHLDRRQPHGPIFTSPLTYRSTCRCGGEILAGVCQTRVREESG